MSKEKELFDGEIIEDTYPATVETTAVKPCDNSTASLLLMAVDRNIDADKLEKLIELKNKEEERQAKKDFNFNFAKMQKEFDPVSKSKQGYEFKYAPVEVLQKFYGPVIAKHGFSYRWREEAAELGKRCVLIISGWGHSEENFFDVPFLEFTGKMKDRVNSVQVAGAMSTYGKRYTFTSGFGLIVEDEPDIDSLSFLDGAEYAEDIKKIRECKTMDELVKVWKGVWTLSNERGRSVLTLVYNQRKKELQGVAK